MSVQDDAIFEAALDRVLRHEGGFVDHAQDPGGATSYGVSLRWLRALGDVDGDGWAEGDLDRDGDVDADDIRRLTRADAARLYRTQFWDRYGYGRLSLRIGGRVFDWAVNMGPANAHRVLQRACRAAAPGLPVLVEDGILGPKTVSVAIGCAQEQLVAAMRAEAAGHYRRLVEVNAALRRNGVTHGDGTDLRDLSVFLKGWLARAYW